TPSAHACGRRTRPFTPQYRAPFFGWIRGSSLMIRAGGILIVLLTDAVRAMGPGGSKGEVNACTGGHVRAEWHHGGAVPGGVRGGRADVRDPSRTPREGLAPGPGDEQLRRSVPLG